MCPSRYVLLLWHRVSLSSQPISALASLRRGLYRRAHYGRSFFLHSFRPSRGVPQRNRAKLHDDRVFRPHATKPQASEGTWEQAPPGDGVSLVAYSSRTRHKGPMPLVAFPALVVSTDGRVKRPEPNLMTEKQPRRPPLPAFPCRRPTEQSPLYRVAGIHFLADLSFNHLVVPHTSCLVGKNPPPGA